MGGRGAHLSGQSPQQRAPGSVRPGWRQHLSFHTQPPASAVDAADGQSFLQRLDKKLKLGSLCSLFLTPDSQLGQDPRQRLCTGCPAASGPAGV